jgi:hypothetical protein
VSSPEFLILPRSKAEAYQPAGVEVCISITNPGEREAVLSTAFKAILRLAFRDIREPSDDPARVLFAPAYACEIVDSWIRAAETPTHPFCLGGDDAITGGPSLWRIVKRDVGRVSRDATRR